MKRLLLFTSFLFLFAIGVPSNTDALGLEFALGVWDQSPEGELAYEPISPTDSLDLEDDLNYDDETRVFGRLKIDMPLFMPNIYLMATPMEFEGDGSKNINFKFGDEIITAGTSFSSELTLDNYDICFYYGIPFIETATLDMLNLEVGINVRIYDFEVSLEQSGSGIDESESFTVPVPMVYLAAQLKPLERWAIEGEARGVIFRDDKVYSLIGRVKFKAFGPLFVATGYRYDKIEIDEEGVLVDTDFSGFFAEAGFAF